MDGEAHQATPAGVAAPKWAQAATGDTVFSVGVMAMLMVITVAYMPIFLPAFITGVEVNTWYIVSSPIFLILSPLIIGLLLRGRYEEMASGFSHTWRKAWTIAIAFLLVPGVIVNFDSIIDLIGTSALLAIVLFLRWPPGSASLAERAIRRCGLSWDWAPRSANSRPRWSAQAV